MAISAKFIIFEYNQLLPHTMMPNRRNFLQLASGALLAGALPISNIFAASLTRLREPRDDEAYWSMVRKQFPLNKDLAYLNNGTMGPSPYYVIDEVQKSMMETDSEGTYSGWEDISGSLARFLKTEEAEIALTRNVTEGINIVAQGLPLAKGDEVIMTTHEHAGNAIPWINIQKQKGIRIRTFSPAPTADETLERIASLINKRTRAIAVPHIPCTQGQILPVKRISALGKEKGIFVFIDGAHGAGSMPLDLHDMGCDAYASCCHKWMLGPKGTGFVYIRKDRLEQVKPVFVGAGSDDAGWNMATEPIRTGSYATTAHRFYGGTYNTGLFKGVGASIEFLEAIGMERIRQRITTLGAYTQQRLLELDDRVEMLTPTEAISRGAIIGFRLKNKDGMQFFSDAMKERVRIRYVPENSLNCLRVSTHIYNTHEEVDRLVELVKKA